MYKHMLSLLLLATTLTGCQLSPITPAAMVGPIATRQLIGSGSVESIANDEAGNTIIIFLQNDNVKLGEQVFIEHTGGDAPQLSGVRVLLTESDTLAQRDYLIESTDTERIRALRTALDQYTRNKVTFNRIEGSEALWVQAKRLLDDVR